MFVRIAAANWRKSSKFQRVDEANENLEQKSNIYFKIGMPFKFNILYKPM